LGFIDEVPHTFAYWEATYPLVNEHGLGFTEATCGAKLMGQSLLTGGRSMFCMAELMRVAMERCTTAVCAIEIMGRLGEHYGFYGEDPGLAGAGESLAVVDRSSAWVFHISGGLNGSSATWVAQRVAANHVAVVANNFIIRKVNCSDSSNFRCSSNIFSNARAAKLCNFDKDSDLDFWHCYALDISTPFAPWDVTLRTWRIQSLANPVFGVTPSDDPGKFAFSLPALRRLSRRDVMNWLRDHYEDTAFDMTQGILAGPFGNPSRIEGGRGPEVVTGHFARGISIPRTNYGVLVQAKQGTKASQSIAWFATDSPATSVFVPFFASTETCAMPYTRGHKEVFSRGSAWWAFNFLANWMNINYQEMSQHHVYPMREAEQSRILQAVEAVEETQLPSPQAVVEELQSKLQESVVQKWWELADQMVVGFSDGVFNAPSGDIQKIGYPAWWLQMIGFNERFYMPTWVKLAAYPPQLLVSSLTTSLFEYDATSARLAKETPELPSAVPALFCGFVMGIILTACLFMLVGFRALRPVNSELSTGLL
jgi:dipeptidase